MPHSRISDYTFLPFNTQVFDIGYQRLKDINDISFFNQPIDLNNEELFYYKNKIILYLDIISNNDYARNKDSFRLKQKLIEKILEKNLFENNEIIKDKDKLNLIIYLISEPESDETNEYLLNLLSSNKFDIENLDEIITKTEFKKCTIEGKNAIIRGTCIFYYDTLQNLCKDNFIKYFKNNKIDKYNDEDIYSFDYLSNKINKHVNDIKDFLKIILKGKVFKESFCLLYGKDYLDFFSNESFLNEIINNHLQFIPFRSNDNCGMTDRFTIDSYTFIENKPIMYNNIDNENKKLVEDALKIGRAISISFHEINHNIYSYLLYFYNKIDYSFQTPRKSKICDYREGGFYMESILFGRIIENLNLEEAMYIMNSDNYNKDLKTFQKDFLNINKKSNINGIFSEFNKINNLINYDSIKNTTIQTKKTTKNNSLKNITIGIKIGKKCVSGINRNFDIQKFNEILKQYH